MRTSARSTDGKLRVNVIAGTRAILMAIDMDPADRVGLRGFAMQRSDADGQMHFLTGMKVFRALAPQNVPKDKALHFGTEENPIQSFLWSDYEASPDTDNKFEIWAMYGTPGHLTPKYKVQFAVRTEQEDDGKHGIWFNRGAIASQAFATKFHNASLTDAEYNDPNNEEVAWLSRGLVEACIGFIRSAKPRDGLRVVAYEFTYLRIIKELKAALDRGVDVKIIYHDTSANKDAAKAAGFDVTKAGRDGVQFLRTRPQTPHNKIIIRLPHGSAPDAVWTGSTNFTPSGFLGQTNVGHLVTDPSLAAIYLQLWTKLSTDPDSNAVLAETMALSPNPANVVPNGTTPVFSRRPSAKMLAWYGDRIEDAATSSMFTGAFTVAPEILRAIAKRNPSMRFILLEKPPTPELRKAVSENASDILVSYGAILGKQQAPQRQQRTGKNAKGQPTKKWVPIPHFEIEKWFIDEELERQTGEGFVFFIHTKFLLIDPLSNDPLICTGSANFSAASLTSNDENMLLIRGNTRAADIYVTEYDRIFRHFYSRDIANETAKLGKVPQFALLDDSDTWSKDYFEPGNAKNHRRLMFSANKNVDWTTRAKQDLDVLAGEKTARAAAKTPGTKKKAAKKKPATKKAAKAAKTSKAAKKKTAKKVAKKKVNKVTKKTGNAKKAKR